MGTAAEYASDGTTLVEVIRRFELQGYTGQFMPVLDEGASGSDAGSGSDAVSGSGSLRCGSCGAVSGAGSFDLGLLRRTEGASDPADMVAVAGLTCPACEAKGTVALKYGPEASPEESDALCALEGKAGPATPPA
jgi:hypothetical protein